MSDVGTQYPLFAQAATRAKQPPTTLALQHFDATYRVQLGELWPSVRSAMLSERKYGALFNNFTQDDVVAELEAQGCRDFVTDTELEGKWAYPVQEKLQDVAHGTNMSESQTDLLTISAAQPQNAAGVEGLKGDNGHQQVSSPPLSSNMRCLVFPRGDITRFKPAR